MNIKDKLYILGFDNIEWFITKEVYLILQKFFQKDIFEEILKYCYKRYERHEHITKSKILNILPSDLTDTIIYMEQMVTDNIYEKNLIYDYGLTKTYNSRFQKKPNDTLTGNYSKNICKDCSRHCNILLDSVAMPYSDINFSAMSGINFSVYDKIRIYQYHEINIMRRDGERVRKLIENEMEYEINLLRGKKIEKKIFKD